MKLAEKCAFYLLHTFRLCLCLLGVLAFIKDIFIDHNINFILFFGLILTILGIIYSFIKILRGPEE